MLFLCNLLYLFVTPVAQIRSGFEQKKLLFWGKILLNIKSAKKNSKLTLIKKNLSTVKEKSESEFVKSGPLDIWKINLLISDLPLGVPTRSRSNEVNRGDGDSPKLPRVI